jgi:hypothetical protein
MTEVPSPVTVDLGRQGEMMREEEEAAVQENNQFFLDSQRYVFNRIFEQVKAVFPISLFLILFRLVVFQMEIENSLRIILMLVVVVFGLTLFIEGS